MHVMAFSTVPVVVMHLRAMILACQLMPAMPKLLLPTAPMIPAMAVPWPVVSWSPVLGARLLIQNSHPQIIGIVIGSLNGTSPG
jgi:hypothetical protein